MTSSHIDLVLYHANCSDGLGAAFCAWTVLGKRAVYIPCSHGNPPPDVKGKNVIILDFSYKNEIIKKMLSEAESLIIIDHHISAQLDLADIKEAYFDMSKSGAMLAWEYFHPDKDAPKFIKYIQDRDLWTWELPYSREFSAAFDMVPFEFEEYDAYCHDSIFDDAVKRGSYILEHKRVFVNKTVEEADKRRLKGFNILVANSSHWINEVGEGLAKDADFAVVWKYDSKKKVYVISLRSDGNIDVSEIAKIFGGGGHKAAAGFIWRGLSIEEIFEK